MSYSPLVDFTRLAGRGVAAADESDPAEVVALLALIYALDSDLEFLADRSNRILDVNDALVARLLSFRPPGDRAIRRFLARWVYNVYARNTLDVQVPVERVDALILGCSRTDLERNAGLLVAEGYLLAGESFVGGSTYKPTPRLIREVERYGAVREDVSSERDYPATLQAYPILAEYREAILAEWNRFATARSEVELASIFRALAPLVEAVLRRVLSTYGSTKAKANLGPMISDLEQRNLGNRGLWSRLNHIVSFARDLAEHGEAVSEPALRVACDEAFDLIPQLSALAKP